MQQVLNELLAREVSLIAPDGLRCDYGNGTAQTADEIHTTARGRTVLLSSEHATRHWTVDQDTGVKRPKLSEPGTAGLGSMAAAAACGMHIAMIGKQTGNANYESGHPYKQHIQALILAHMPGAFLSLHGMKTGLVSDLQDDRPYDLLVGTGNNPNAASQVTAQMLVQIAEGLGLRAAINAQFLDIIRGDDGHYKQRVYRDGTPMAKVFAAPDYTTRAAAQRTADAAGYNMPALQLEFAGNLRIWPRKGLAGSKPQAGPYLGWKLLQQTISMLQPTTEPEWLKSDALR